jgi:pimeloyl-ACP methyl ester carboxylesterase
MTAEHYDALTRWESSAGQGPVLRGRHSRPATKPMQETIHFLHGNGFCGGVYWPMLQQLLPDYALFTHDIEGHGDSDAPSTFSGVRAIVRRIPQIMADQNVAPGNLIGMGHSFGGALTLRVAAENPGLFKAIVLLDPIVIPPLPFFGLKLMSLIGRHPLSRPTRRRRDTWPSRAAVMDSLRGRGAFKNWTEAALHCFAQYAIREVAGECKLACPKELEVQIFEHPVYPWNAFQKVKVPILFLRGMNSYDFFPWAERLARRANSAITFQQLPGWHCFMQEDPTAASAAVRTFLRQHLE